MEQSIRKVKEVRGPTVKKSKVRLYYSAI